MFFMLRNEVVSNFPLLDVYLFHRDKLEQQKRLYAVDERKLEQKFNDRGNEREEI
jgi:hypothetical protein